MFPLNNRLYMSSVKYQHIEIKAFNKHSKQLGWDRTLSYGEIIKSIIITAQKIEIRRNSSNI